MVASTFSFSPTFEILRLHSHILRYLLWFMSLVAALTTAFFIVLVQQWLQEYTVNDYEPPQAHLRLHHFCRAGLGD